MARYGMLHCGRNMGGSIKKDCETCNALDDEEHILNRCPKWTTDDDKDQEDIEFAEIYSSDPESLRTIIKKIESVWNTKTGNGSLKTS